MRLVIAACLFTVFAIPAAQAYELLRCQPLREVVGAGPVRPAANLPPRLITVDEFKEIVLFDETTLGVNTMNEAVIIAWGAAVGAHGPEKLSLYLDRRSGQFRYVIATDSQPKFTWRLEGVCAVDSVNPRF